MEIKVYSVEYDQGEGIGLEKIVGSIEEATNVIDEAIEKCEYDLEEIKMLNNPDSYIYEIAYEIDNEFLYGIKEHIVEVEI